MQRRGGRGRACLPRKGRSSRSSIRLAASRAWYRRHSNDDDPSVRRLERADSDGATSRISRSEPNIPENRERARDVNCFSSSTALRNGCLLVHSARPTRCGDLSIVRMMPSQCLGLSGGSPGAGQVTKVRLGGAHNTRAETMASSAAARARRITDARSSACIASAEFCPRCVRRMSAS